MSLLIRIAALVAFILAALFAFGVGSYGTDSILGWISVGLALWVGSTVAPANLP